jgi:hypothetical protein
MKIRSDFVTNSSSSSFVVMNVESETLSNILKKFADELLGGYISVEVNGEELVLSTEDYVEPPEKVLDIVPAIAKLFCYEVYIPNSYEDEDEEEEAKEEFEEILEEDEVYSVIAKEIIENREAIEKDLKVFSGEFSDYSYGGDSDALYYRENYDEEYLNEILEKIAEENHCTIDEIDNDAFIRYVGKYIGEDKVSVDYSRDLGEINSSRTFRLNNFW